MNDSHQGDGSLSLGGPAPRPPELRSEEEIVAEWSTSDPVVSILCPTYQHAAYLDDALRGFLGQRGDVPFEVLVRDDASTDGTAQLAADYERRYSRIVRAILEPSNTWPQVRALHVLLPLTRGRFLIVCEGDDYWVDPDMLVRQVAALEARPDCVAVHHQAVVEQSGVIVNLEKLPRHLQRDLTSAELRRGAWMLLPTMLFRKVPLERHPRDELLLNHDVFTAVQLGAYGGAAWMDDLQPAVYRRHTGGVWSMLDDEVRLIRRIESLYWIVDWLVDVGDHDAARDVLKRATSLLSRSQRARGVTLPVATAPRADSPTTGWARVTDRWRRILRRARRR